MLAALVGDRHENADAYRIALRHAERAGDVVQIVRIHTNRGSRHMEEGQYDAALRELDAAIELAELIGSDNFGALAYSNRGDTYRHLGRLDDALDDLRRAEAIWQRLGSGLIHYAVGLLADVQALRGQRSEAIALYRQAIELADAQGDTQALVPGLIGLARTLAADDPAAAAEAAARAIGTARSMSMSHAHLAAGWLELRRGDTAAAARSASAGLQFGQAHQDRSAVAEALLLQASLSNPPDRAWLRNRAASHETSATGSPKPGRPWRSPARSSRGTRRGDRRRRAPARRSRRAGRARRGPRIPVATGRRQRHRVDARRVPRQSPRRARRDRRVGIAKRRATC